jgi:Ca2+-binding EF-hand superfamily protein
MVRLLILAVAVGVSVNGVNAAGAGKIDKAKLFARMDANGDGKLTREEFAQFAAKVAEHHKDKGKSGKGGHADKLFDKIDANHDGVITLDEFEKFHAGGAKAKNK